jgi:hypothetical protein
MPATSIQLTPTVVDAIQSAALQYGVDARVMEAIAAVGSGGAQDYVSSTGAVGVMSVTPEVGLALGFDVTQQSQNILAGAAYLHTQLENFGGNYALAIAAYYADADTVEFYDGVPPLPLIQNFVYNVTSLAAKAGCPYVSQQATLKSASLFDAGTSAAASSFKLTAGNYTPPQGTVVDTQQSAGFQSSLYEQLQIDTGLNPTPWYDPGSGLLTGNPRVRRNVQPVTFQIFLSQQTGQPLTNPDTNQPIVLELNTSMTDFEIASKHVWSHTPSRTGVHITLWGMEPDLISGSGSTGVFLNRFGLTDFFSVANVTDDIKQLVTSGFAYSTGTQGQVFPSFVNNETMFNTILAKQTQGFGGSNIDPSTAFRVAAQDAFVEFLSMFKMNGNVWFYNPSSNGYLNGQTQSTPTGWSPRTGTSTFQQNARNNDVYSRGGIVMRYRNNSYQGYFKSLNWTLDAENPFQWKFSFSFQVERTYTQLFNPKAGAGGNNSGVLTSGQAQQITDEEANA